MAVQKSAVTVVDVHTTSPTHWLGTHACGNKHVPADAAMQVASLEQIAPLPVHWPEAQFEAVVHVWNVLIEQCDKQPASE